MIRLLSMVFNVLEFTIFAEVVLSWVYPRGSNQYIELLHKVSGPLLLPGRKIQEKYFSNTMIDFSPIIALVIIMFARSIVIGLLG